MLYVYIFSFSAVLYLYFGMHAFIHNPNDKSNKLFAILTFLFFSWAIITSSLHLITNPNFAVLLRKHAVFSWGFIYSIIFHMILSLSMDNKKYSKAHIYFLIYFPSLINIYLYWLSPVMASEITYTNIGWLMRSDVARSWIWNNYFYIYYVSFLIASLILLIVWNKNAESKREKKQSKLILITLSISMILGSVFEVILPINGVSIVSGVTIIIALLPIAGIFYAIMTYDLMSFSRVSIGSKVMLMMQEGIVILDKEGSIILANEGARNLFEVRESDNFSSIYQVLSSKLIKTRNQSSFEAVINSFCGNSIEVLCSTTDLKDSLEEVVGSVWVFQNISSLKESQRDLKRLNISLEEIVQKRTQSLKDTNETLIDQIRDRRMAEEQVDHLANFDHLTGLPNLRNFNRKLSLITKLSALNNSKFAIVFLDLDNFKHVNDTLGHSIGDELLIEVSNRFELTLRSCDYVARNGGDEFIIIIENIEEGHSLNSAIKRINSVFETPFILTSGEISISSSMGVAIYPTHSMETEELIKFADIAMYHSKNSGKNRYTIFNNELGDNLSNKVQIINDIKLAIAHDQFFLNYQPQVNSVTNEIVGAEALIRWMHPEKGVISPLDFIKISEENNLIIPIGNWVIKEVFSKLEEWSKDNVTIPTISINLSVKQLQSNELIEHIKYCLRKYKIHPSLIEFEVTETSIMLFEKQVTQSIDEIHELGFGIAIDDFGVEYSSLRYIKHLPIKTLKIDKLFIDGINVNLKDEAIIKSIITLSKDLDFNIVAEGVEKNDQVDFLNNLSCDIIQGYIFSKPLDSNDFKKFITSSVNSLGESAN